jgi:acetyl-CoA C-acetyltransferase
MTTSASRNPAVAGCGEITQHPGAGADLLGALDLTVEAARRAGADAGGRLLERVEVVASVMSISLRHPDPGRLVADRLGLSGVRTLQSWIGGNIPQLLLNELGAEIDAGRLDVALIVGVENVYSRKKKSVVEEAVAELAEPLPPGEPAPRVGDDRPGWTDDEAVHQVAIPTAVYPLFEAALRAAAGRDLEEHRRLVSELWARFAAVSGTRAAAWSQKAWSAEEIRTPGPENRMATYPYTKMMCANIFTDQAAAVLLCSPEAARAAGVPDERLVYLHAGADGADRQFLTERASLAESPGIRAVTGDALAAAGVDVDDIARFDLYSCFPSAVQMAMRELGLTGPAGGDDRPLTVTGGLSFFGGPGNNYVTHSVAAMADACRADPGSLGMVTGVGYFLTKHSAGIYSTRPPERGYVRADPAATKATIDATPGRARAGAYAGPATVEATAVQYNRQGDPAVGLLATLTPDGRRALANSTDPSVMASMVTEEWACRPVELTTDGAVNRLAGSSGR